jgi:hypothetical protein
MKVVPPVPLRGFSYLGWTPSTEIPHRKRHGYVEALIPLSCILHCFDIELPGLEKCLALRKWPSGRLRNRSARKRIPV